MERFFAKFADRGASFLLARDLPSFDQSVVDLTLHGIHDFLGGNMKLAGIGFRSAALLSEFEHELEDGLNAFFVAESDRLEDRVIFDFGSADFDHVDAVGMAGKDEVQIRVLHL